MISNTPSQTRAAVAEQPSVSSLDALFSPTSVAVVGASPRATSAGGRVVEHITSYGYEGRVVPVNPRYEEIFGLACFGSVADIPEPVDLVMVCTPADTVVDVARVAATSGVKAVVVHSDGLVRDDLAELKRLTAADLRIVGPNTNGLRVYPTGMFADASSGLNANDVKHGPIAVITQSGGLGGYFGATYLRRRGLAPKILIDTGNELDVTAADCLEYLAADEEVRAIGLILEGARNARRLAAAVEQARAAGKKVLILRLANNPSSMAAAASHTGAIAGRFDVYRQILTDEGAEICEHPRLFADALLISAAGSVPQSNRIAVVTPSGGFGVLAADIGVAAGLEFPPPQTPPNAVIQEKLGLTEISNPLDVSARYAGSAGRMGAGIDYMASQRNIDALVVWHPHALLDERGEELITTLEAAARDTSKPIFHCGATSQPVRDRLWSAAGILSFEAPDDILCALGLLVSRPKAPAAQFADPTVWDRADGVLDSAGSATKAKPLVGREAADLLSLEAGVRFPDITVVASAESAVAFAQSIGAAVVLKGEAPGVIHKTELGLVGGPYTAEQLTDGYHRLAENARRNSDQVVITAERAVSGVEIAIGTFFDESFGPVVMVSAGGSLVELLGDVHFAAAPVDVAGATRLLQSLRVSRLLNGFRGSRASDVAAAAELIASISNLAARPDFAYDVELNPVLVGPVGTGVIAVDAVLAPTARPPG